MPRNVLVIIWRVETISVRDNDLFQKKIMDFEEKVLHALYQVSFQAVLNRIADPMLVFLAPEYLFVQSDSVRGIEWTDKDRLIERCKQLSSAYPWTMIIPGTVMWLEPASSTRSWFGTKPKRQARNSAFIFFNGQLHFRHDKRVDASELLEAEKQKCRFEPGSGPGTFECGGVSFVLEICAEHTSPQVTNSGEADVHLYLSATNPHHPSKVQTRSGGVLVHADGKETRRSIEAVNSNKTGVFDVSREISPSGFTQTKLTRRLSSPAKNQDRPKFSGMDADISVYHLEIEIER